MKLKAIVNHTGSCTGEHYKRGEATELSEHVIKALGKDVTVLEEIKVKEEPKVEEKKEEKKEIKEAKKPLDRMMKKEQVVTK